MEKDSGSIFMGEKRKQERSQRLLLSNDKYLHRGAADRVRAGGCAVRASPGGLGSLDRVRGGCACSSEPRSIAEHYPPESSLCPGIIPSVKLFFPKSWVHFIYFLECLTVP